MTQETPSLQSTLRIAKANSSQLSVCIQNKLWAATRNRLSAWKAGERLLVFAENGPLVLGSISGPSYESDLLIFEGGFFPYRIPLSISVIVEPSRAVEVMSEVRRLLSACYGSRYGMRILMQLPLAAEVSADIISFVVGHVDPDDLNTKSLLGV